MTQFAKIAILNVSSAYIAQVYSHILPYVTKWTACPWLAAVDNILTALHPSLPTP